MLSERKKKILYAVINDYIQTALPVGSQTISKHYNVGLSSASIRNIMAELEEMGYLTQPYTSAGRIPTDTGFRFYVDTLLKIKALKRQEQERIRSWLKRNKLKRIDVEEVMKETSRVLSLFTKHLGLVLAPKITNTEIKRIELVHIRDGYVLVILVSISGVLHNRMVDIGETVSQADLDRMSNFLNSIASHLTIKELKKKILEEMKREKNLFDKLLKKALEIGRYAVTDAEEDEEIYIEGRTNILTQPEFSDIQKMKKLFNAFENKALLIKILDECMESEGIQVYIGSENEIEEIKGCSIIAKPYRVCGETLGTLGVIGPTRMDYGRIIPLVEYTAELVSEILTMGKNP